MSIARADARWFGVPPPLVLLLLVVAAVVAGIALLAAGRWPYALILLGVAALLAAMFLEVARRRPDSRSPARPPTRRRRADRARATVESLIARSSAVAETQRVRSARAVIRSERRAALARRGGRDDEAARRRRATLAELDRRRKSWTIVSRRGSPRGRARRSARLSVQQTVLVRPAGRRAAGAAAAPEPYPPPTKARRRCRAGPEPQPDEDSRRPAA